MMHAGLTLKKSIDSGPLRVTQEDRLENVKFGVEGLGGPLQEPGLVGGAYLSAVVNAVVLAACLDAI